VDIPRVELNEPAAGAISGPAVMLSLSRCARNRTGGRLSRNALAALLLMDVLDAPFSRTFKRVVMIENRG
jgi:hypothetical protein